MEKNKYKSIFFAVCSAIALSIDMGVPGGAPVLEKDVLSEILWNIKCSFTGQGLGLLPLFLFAFFVYLDAYIDNKHITEINKIGVRIVNFVISAIWLFAEGFRRKNETAFLFSSGGQIIKSVIYIIGVYNILRISMFCFYFLINRKNQNADKEKNIIAALLEKYPFRTYFVLIFVCWLPYIIIAYPGYFCHDAYNQLSQYFGINQWTSHHPPLSTLVMGTIVDLGARIVNGNFGIFLYIFLQTLIFALINAYMMKLISELKINDWIRNIILITVLFVPYYSAYIAMLLKDNTYSYMVLLLVIELVYMLILKDEYFKSKKHFVLWFVAVIGTMLLRNNGKYIIYPLIFYVIIDKLISKERKLKLKKIQVVLFVIVMISPVVIANVITSAMNQHFEIEKGSIREALSLPMQQTARYVKNCKEDVTEEEAQVLKNIMDYDNLDELYDPRISDPVKATFKYNPTSEELKAYIKVWAKQFLRHPKEYIDATLNQNYYLLYIGVKNAQYYVNDIDSSTNVRIQAEIYDLLGLESVSKLKAFKSRVWEFYGLCFSLPVLNLLAHPALYNILLIWIVCFMIIKKNYKALVVALPAIITFLVIIAAPVIQGHPRYAFPIIYTLPLIIAYYLYSSRIKDENNVTVSASKEKDA